MAYTDEELGTLLVNIAKINNQLSDEKFLKSLNGDTLSYTGLKLAAMKASVIDLKVDAQQDMLNKEVLMLKAKAVAYYRYKEELGPNGKPHGATAAGDMKYMDEDFIKAQNVYNTAKVQYEKLRDLLKDTHDVIESARSRVIDLQGQRKNETVK